MGAAECIDQGTQRGKILRIHVIKLDADVGAVHSYQQAVATKRRLAVEFQGHGVMRARIQIDAAIVFEQRAVEGQVQDAACDVARATGFEPVTSRHREARLLSAFFVQLAHGAACRLRLVAAMLAQRTHEIFWLLDLLTASEVNV